MATKRDTILLFKVSRWSHTNASVAALLQREFPQADVIVVDILEEIKRRRLVLAMLLVSGAFKYLPPIWRGKGEFGFFFFTEWGRRYVNRLIRSLAVQAARSRRILFSFQTTTRINATIPGIPHFAYIDTVETLKLAERGDGAPASRLERDVIAHEREIFGATSGVFTICDIVRDAVVRDYHCPPVDIRTVYAGPNATAPATSPRSRGYEGGPIILFVAVEWHRKGGDILLAAFRKVQSQQPQARLWLVGVNPAAAEGVANCTVWGRQDKAAVGGFLDQASIFCLPSRRDFFPISLIEAMAAGLPVVATATGGIPEIIEDQVSGLIVPVGDSEALASALLRLLGDPALRTAMGTQAARVVAERLNWNSVGDQIGHAIRDRLGLTTRQPPIPTLQHIV